MGGKNNHMSGAHFGLGAVCSATCFTVLSGFGSIDSLEV